MIYFFEEILNPEENEQLAEVAISYSQKYEGKGKLFWRSAKNSPKNSYFLNDIDYPEIVRVLSDRCENLVNKLTEKINLKCKATEVWYNVYDNTQYQEPHNHGGAIFSLVYFNKLPQGSSTLKFIDKSDDILYKERMVVIFVSGLEHYVDSGTNVDPRITWSFNYA